MMKNFLVWSRLFPWSKNFLFQLTNRYTWDFCTVRAGISQILKEESPKLYPNDPVWQMEDLEKTQRLKEILAKLDPRAETRVREGGLFKSAELLRRKLVHEGNLLWKTPGSRPKGTGHRKVTMMHVWWRLWSWQDAGLSFVCPCFVVLHAGIPHSYRGIVNISRIWVLCLVLIRLVARQLCLQSGWSHPNINKCNWTVNIVWYVLIIHPDVRLPVCV